MNNPIPQLSLELLKNKDPHTISLLEQALEQHGFFTITDHGLEDRLLEQSYEASKNFFNLPLNIKNQYAQPQYAGARGYTHFGKETALGESVADLKEFWHHGPELDHSFDSRIHSNISVTELEDFNKHCAELFLELNRLGMVVLESIALILKKPENFFNSWVSKGNSVLRLIHYPALADDSNILRARPHEDINLITLLVGAEESGLEVKNQQGDWIPIAAKSKSIVCNIGDMMQLVTRSQLKSTTHRVIDHNVKDSKPRYSMPFFLHPSPEIMLNSIVDDSPDSISAHEFLEERLKAIKLY
ncbi:MAG: 2OG-Fe(II) oxygenase [SAR86 cluster bacterium BACL1 MAG-120920-bin57]|jgi:isopenicillin N synthase-like dioxygenase|uniref:2-oxoglutarate-dependent ethylene/succinate-forming enzyme n=1 Tax=SAR86 cluster bacterium BACL1 MAG-120920-bin57 TaxID=1655571 RepID=A0A0R2PR52_9GAMM|nr:MAG: 2OG-Fe(II) oxygenase [SAR86 cluster bacterium BACL1 MAG-120920-bin57]KRP01011.1 MAG: 2OG-Fe(II) oxygenase [SAR86 cluster bacterium BACL1 MAG-120619-bin26]KRP14742.1 MAG: 2OG-Fe(II) oxygenase [SAR86 cluster bacterium BACL1 MAG-121001-bin56]|tara:strand:- start:396 stop:1298 length:903 start_codon:yes stop_codon:yes gene_type:complete